jgi:hypothetical protein
MKSVLRRYGINRTKGRFVPEVKESMNKKKTTWLALLCSMSLIGASCTKSDTPLSSAESKTSTQPTSSSSSSVVTKATITYGTGEGYTLTGPSSVDVGSDLTFTLVYEEGYAGGTVSASGGTLIDNKDGTYSIAGVKGDIAISVAGVAKITLTITYPTGEHFTLTGEKSVAFGSSYTFSVVFEAGYSGIVKVNGETVTLAEDGSYMIPVVKANVLITVEGVDIATYPVSLPTGEGYTLTADKEVVKYGESLTFTFHVLANYSGGVVKVNGTAIVFDSNGQATIQNITGPLTITVEGLIKTITMNYVSGTGYHFSGPATANLGDSVTFTLTYEEGYQGGTVMAGTTALSPNTDGTYTIASIGDETAKITLLNVEQIIASSACDFEGTDGNLTVSEEASFIDSADGFKKSTKVVTGGDTSNSAYRHPRVLANAILGDYKEISFAISSGGTHYWELLSLDGKTTYAANNNSTWKKIRIALDGALYRLYVLPGAEGDTLGWTATTFEATTNMMDLKLRLADGDSYYVSEMIGVRQDESLAAPYSVIAASPVAQAGTVSTSVYPKAVPVASKSTLCTYGWGRQTLTDLALANYREILFYVMATNTDTSGFWYSGFFYNGSAVGSEDPFKLNSWRVMRLTQNSDGTFAVTGNNYLNNASMALSNLNQLNFQTANQSSYYFSEVFGIAK